ncbi:helix-turn-helix domain-containing protein [Budvicia aquatica]|uniref:Predicted transcriptional regulator n=1 Tax=Budvicia aquatica TaxID=82979 RepID=A0A2C6DRD2_9GAMM|nr:helix-turn-helix transcriptional regulator [Budvicia aquatica]PHI31263.1 XRE family transcriptional regulator [Budvicia aquatica]VFS51549.1 Predicted transcriptional regulator [Budvicia aquatica]
MVRCYLSRMMGERKLKIADVSRATKLPRSTITMLYKETAAQVDFSVVEKLCHYFECHIGDLFEYQRTPSHEQWIREKGRKVTKKLGYWTMHGD